ncbi:MAG TPA: hypothetical protein VIV12_11945 [Streptosporangiaceae bacterium]
MPTTPLRLSLTFALACGSATFFLFLRCEGKGNPLGTHSRWWSLAVIGLTGALSTGATLLVATIIEELPSGLVSLSAVAPCWLWIGHIRQGSPERRSPFAEAATLWLTWLLARMAEGMAEDKTEWLERRANPDWDTDDLMMAARRYHEYLHGRLSAADRRRYRIRSLLRNIETRLDIARLIDNSARPAKVIVALNASRLTQDTRYVRNVDDLTRLGNLLRHDAHQDLIRMLSPAYNLGFRRLAPYAPPMRGSPPQALSVGSQRPHP